MFYSGDFYMENFYEELANLSEAWNISYNYNGSLDVPPDVRAPSRSHLDTSSVLTLVAYALTLALGVPGNAAVVWVTCRMPRPSPSAVLFLHLAVADLAYCLTLPFQAAHLALRGAWPQSLALCKLLPCAIVLNMSASVFLLALVSADRCAAVTAPVWSLRRRTPRLVHGACCVAWLLACLMCLPSLLTRTVVSSTFGFTYCTIEYSGTLFGRRTKVVVEVSRAVFAFGLPVLVMAVCYLLVALRLRGRRFGRTLRLAAAVVAAFVACWLPYHVCGLVQAYATRLPSAAWDHASVALASLNSALNPLLYVFAGRDFRRVLRRSIATSLRMAFTEEGLSTGCSSRGVTRSSMEASV